MNLWHTRPSAQRRLDQVSIKLPRHSATHWLMCHNKPTLIPCMHHLEVEDMVRIICMNQTLMSKMMSSIDGWYIYANHVKYQRTIIYMLSVMLMMCTYCAYIYILYEYIAIARVLAYSYMQWLLMMVYNYGLVDLFIFLCSRWYYLGGATILHDGIKEIKAEDAVAVQ